MKEVARPRTIGVVLFDGFELLDVFGPLEMFGELKAHFAIRTVGPTPGPVASAQGPQVLAEVAYEDAAPCDVVFVPGGIGSRAFATNESLLAWLSKWAETAEFVCSVCTGSGVLGAAGLLEGYRATSNREAFAWASSQGDRVEWIPSARWVVDGNRWTSSGVSAGIDMTFAFIERPCGTAVADELADAVEYERHLDPTWDPFAERRGLR